MYFLLNMGIFQPAMLVYQTVYCSICCWPWNIECHYINVVLQAVGASDPSAGTARPRRRSWHSTCGPQPFHWPYRCYRLVVCPIPINSCVISRELHPYGKNCFKEFKNGWLECLPFSFCWMCLPGKRVCHWLCWWKFPAHHTVFDGPDGLSNILPACRMLFINSIP